MLIWFALAPKWVTNKLSDLIRYRRRYAIGKAIKIIKILAMKIGFSAYRYGRARTKNEPETTLLNMASQSHGKSRRIISSSDWFFSASSRARRLIITIEPMTAATPKIWTVWIIGGNPGTFCRGHRAAACRELLSIMPANWFNFCTQIFLLRLMCHLEWDRVCHSRAKAKDICQLPHPLMQMLR